MKIFGGGLCAVVLAAAMGSRTLGAAASCDSLASMALPQTTITLASVVEAGAFTPPGSAGANPSGPAGQLFRGLPAFCRVAATMRPSSDSDIKVEVWLPAAGWNGKFQAVGNGGWAGTITYAAMASALQRGYATASTDTGHAGTVGDASFALNHPEKVVDFAYRAVHEMTVQAKAIVEQHYGSGPRLSYWNGCSTGGRQGLKEAQKYPADYDGIIAGAPANFMTHLGAHSLWVAQATLKDPASFIPREKFAMIHQAVLDACDALDGVKDGVLEDPRRCHFDPKTIQCTAGDSSGCLTPPQVEAVRRIYAPAKNPRTGAEIFPGLEPGSETGWVAMAGGPRPLSISNDHFRFLVFKNPDWDFKTLDFDKDVALADRLDDGLMNATDPNLSAFFKRGGRLLMYHGWNDQLIAPRNSINYYQSVVKAQGGAEKAADSIRLFMVPGMAHCGGGDGTSVFDSLAVLEQWVEQKKTPAQIPASHLTNGVRDRTRPLCAYPSIAAYTGSGDTNDAANFRCGKP
ncbi:MAG TPA: tannase/feruloyl esterase family alpha/beta hydrolase [Vicinamibacterales bacterium]|nr:tannase/feruloyl esterase family alpha/beta hydrolase [Vicinamibacterales bacterium]